MNAFDKNGVFVRLHREIVGELERGQHVAEIGGKLTANAGDAAEQGRIGAAFDQLNQAEAYFNGERFDFQKRFGIVLFRGLSIFRRFFCVHA